MARTISRADLRARIYTMGNFDNATDRHEPAFVNECINASYPRLYNALVQAGEHYSAATSFFDTVAGTSVYSLPNNHLKTLACFIEIDGVMRELRGRSIRQPHDATYTPQFTGYTYITVGNNIEIEPTPSGVYGIELRYAPTPAKLLADIDVVDGISGWEEYIVYDVVALLKGKDEQYQDAQFWSSKADAMMRDITDKGATRNFSEPAKIHRRRIPVLPRRWLR